MLKNLFKILPLPVSIILLLLPGFSKGAQLANLSDDLSKLQQNAFSDHTIKFTSHSGVNNASDTIILTFPDGFNLDLLTFTDINLSHGPTVGDETSEVLRQTPDSTSWGITILNQTITLHHPTDDTKGDINPEDIVLIKIGTNTTGGIHQIRNGIAGNYTILIGGSFNDIGSIPIIILSNDQIYSDGDVIPSISLTLSSPTTSFGLVNLGSIAASTPDITLTVATNHANGYNIKIFDTGDNTHPGLYKPADSRIPAQIIGSADLNFSNTVDLNSVITGYGIQAQCISGCNTQTEIKEKYQSQGTTVAGLRISPELFMEYPDYLTVEHVVKIKHLVKTSEYARTGQYFDHITYQATANF